MSNDATLRALELLGTEYGQRPTLINWKVVAPNDERAVIGSAVVRVYLDYRKNEVVGEILGALSVVPIRVQVAEADPRFNPQAYAQTRQLVVRHVGKLALEIVNAVLAELVDDDLTAHKDR